MINACEKGKRVELEVANWLKSLGATSARRTQQHNGAEGLSDVVADELPQWHIEVKGTTNPMLTKGRLRKWYKQITRDCPPEMQAVIIHKANNEDYTAILHVQDWRKLPESSWDYIVCTEGSVNPSKFLKVNKIKQAVLHECDPISFRVYPGVVLYRLMLGERAHSLVMMEASMWYKLAVK